MPSKYKFLIGAALCLVIVAAVIVGIHLKHGSAGKPVAVPDVEVIQVAEKSVPIYDEWIGTLDGLTNADVRAQVTGYLMRQDYHEGSYVSKGQLLFEIDP